MNCPLRLCPESNCHKPNPTRPKKFPTGDRLSARKTDAPAESASYEVFYHPFNGPHTVPEGRSAQRLRLVYGIITNRELSALVKLGKFFKALKPLKQRLLNQRSFGLNMVPGIELFSRCSDGPNIFATWAFNKRKVFREKNPEDCTEISHQSPSVNRGQALGLLVRLSFIPLRTST